MYNNLDNIIFNNDVHSSFCIIFLPPFDHGQADIYSMYFQMIQNVAYQVITDIALRYNAE